MIGHRQRHGDLAIFGLADPAAVSAHRADRMRAFLRKAPVVDDPRSDRAVRLDHCRHQSSRTFLSTASSTTVRYLYLKTEHPTGVLAHCAAA